MEHPHNNTKNTGRWKNVIVLSSLISLIVTTLILIIWPSVYKMVHTYDIKALKVVNSNRIKSLDPIFLLITNTSSIICITITALTLFMSRIIDSAMLKLKGLQLLLTFLSSFIVIKLLKYLIGRERPYITYDFLNKIAQAESLSFPSGHTFEAFAYATAVMLAFKSHWASFLVFIWAALVGLSRMTLGMHYLSDVLGGIALGVFTGYVVHVLYRKNIYH